MSNDDLPSIEHDGEWYKIRVPGDKKTGSRSVTMITQQPGYDLFQKALKEHLDKNKDNQSKEPE